MPIISDGQTLAKENVFYAPRKDSDDSAPGWCLVRLAKETWRPDFMPRMQRGTSIALFWCIGGCGCIDIEGDSTQVRSGTMLVHGLEDIRIRSQPETPLSFLLLTLAGAGAREFLRRFLPEASPVMMPNNPHDVTGVLETVFAQAKGHGPYSRELCEQYVPIVLLTLRRGMVETGSNCSRSMAMYFTCKDYIDQNCDTMRRVTEAADAVGISASYMSRLFRRHEGIGPHSYLLRLRMSRAAHLLQTTALSVQEISGEFGFSDAYTFSKTFKRIMGLSPRFYRNEAGWLGFSSG